MAIQSKLPPLIIGKIQKLAQQMIPTISQIVEKTGIQNIGQPNMTMPNTCLPQSDLQNILKLFLKINMSLVVKIQYFFVKNLF